MRKIDRTVAGVIATWAAVVALGAYLGAFQAFPLPLFAALVAAGIAAPVLVYQRSAALRGSVERFGLRRLTALHVWRVPAALTFFYYGAQDLLPDVFVTLAAWGDFLAGVLAAVVTLIPARRALYWAFHAIGMADFVVAVGTGLTFSLLGDPEMRTIAGFPLALIPLFGVALSGATHIMAFDLLRRRAGVNKYSSE